MGVAQLQDEQSFAERTVTEMAPVGHGDAVHDENHLVRTFYEAYNSFGPVDDSSAETASDGGTVLIDDLPARWQSNA